MAKISDHKLTMKRATPTRRSNARSPAPYRSKVAGIMATLKEELVKDSEFYNDYVLHSTVAGL